MLFPRRSLAAVAGLVSLPALAHAQWTEDFDSYADGSFLDGQGGWEAWAGTDPALTVVSDDQAFSGPNSAALFDGGDTVRYTPNVIGGRWTVRAKVWLPSGNEATDDPWFVVLSDYHPEDGTLHRWGGQVNFDYFDSSIEIWLGSSGVVEFPGILVFDDWSEIRLELDLDADWADWYYDATYLGGHQWSAGFTGDYTDATRRLHVIDLYNDPDPGGAPFYYDDVEVVFLGGGDVGTRYCDPAVPNSTGLPAEIAGFGSDFAGGQPLRVTASQLPASQFGYLLTSMTQDFIASPPGSQGVLCLGGTIGRFVADVQSSGAAGTFLTDVDTEALPIGGGTAAMAGESWSFQYWHRDKNPTQTSNFTDGIEVMFQ